jgi:hypothetical protein
MRVKVTKNYVMTTIVEDVESWEEALEMIENGDCEWFEDEPECVSITFDEVDEDDEVIDTLECIEVEN